MEFDYMKLKFGVLCFISATRIIGAILFSQTINSHQKPTYSDTIWFTYLIVQDSMSLFSKKMNATAHNIKHFQHDQSGTQYHSDRVSS
jgi:hypothetical protein